MAGEIQLNSTTMATESSGSITAELDTIRPNTTNGSLTLQGDSSDAGVTGLTIDSSGNVTFAGTGNNIGTVIAGTLGSSVNIKASINASGSAPIYACRAWVNFDGTTNTAGFCTIRDSGNVSSITDNNPGNWTVNFTTSMSDNNYAAFASFQTPVWGDLQIHNYSFTTSGFTIGIAVNTTGSGTDAGLICAAVIH